MTPPTSNTRMVLEWLRDKGNHTITPEPYANAIELIERLTRELWRIAELIWTNASRDDVKHWAEGIKVSIRGGAPPSFAFETSGDPSKIPCPTCGKQLWTISHVHATTAEERYCPDGEPHRWVAFAGGARRNRIGCGAEQPLKATGEPT